MADSDHNRTLPHVTRRTSLAIVAGSLMARMTKANPAMPATGDTTLDPALSLWRDWTEAHQNACRLGRQQQALERELVSIAGFPTVEVRIPDRLEPISVTTDADIDRWLGRDDNLAMARASARTALAIRRRAWEAADERIGYSRIRQEEEAATEEGEQIAEALWDFPARSLAGAAGKLHAALIMGETSEDCEEFPWPQLRSVLADLVRLDSAPVTGIEAA